MSERIWHYEHCLDFGHFELKLPDRLSQYDVEMLKEHFKLILVQCERRAERTDVRN